MPVKSTRFKTQTIFDGEITGLNEREKNVFRKAGIGGTPENVLVIPAGLTKTELVGVGANGQENIEIGDNLTLANGKLSATGGGSGGSTLYCHYISMTKFSGENAIGYIGFNYYNNSNEELNDLTKITSALADKCVLCSGFVKHSALNKYMDVLDISASDGSLFVDLFYTIDGLTGTDIIDNTYDIMDTVFQVA